MSGFRGFVSELRRRKVVRVALVYLIVAWLLVQVAEVTFEPLQLPDWTLTLVIVLIIIGFPLALILAWAFDLTPEGIQRDRGSTGDAPEPATPDDDRKDSDAAPSSIAVLPFLDMSPDQDQGYFCEGIAEEILNTLSKLRGLSVASRTAAFQFGERGADIMDIGRRLNVQTVLEGSVRKFDDQLRVTAQLINVADGFHLWSDKFDAHLCDVFQVQDEIAENITRALRLRLSPEDQRVLQGSRTQDVEAYDYYLRAWSYFHKFGRRNVETAREMFLRALEIDPDFARAWAGLADSAAFLYMYANKNDAYSREATEASCKAVELCPDLAEAHASRGLAHTLCQEFPEAEEQFEKAIERDPELFEAFYFYGRACVHQGKYEKAAQLFEKAHELRPEDFQSAMLLPQIYDELGRMDEAVFWEKRGLEAAARHLALNPDDIRAVYLTAGAHARLGKREKAIEFAERALRLDPGDTAMLYNVACVYALLGEVELALDCLEKGAAPGMASRGWVEHDGHLKALHGHPRFEAVLDSLD